MPRFSPTVLAQVTGGIWHNGEPDELRDLCFDARKLEPGECFVALSSGSRDGHEFVAQAEEKGAAAAITERVLDLPLPQLVVADSLLAMGAIARDLRAKFTRPVVGITGSCGKTSTKEMLRLLLGETLTHATAGNWNNRIGVPMTLYGLNEKAHQFAVIEAGINQPGEMQLLGEMIRADLTILTNIGPAHLELLGSLDGIASEKARLAGCALAGSPIILPADALQYDAFAELRARCIVLAGDDAPLPNGLRGLVRYSSKPGDGASRRLYVDGHEYLVHTASEGIAANAALALVAARELGVEEADLARRIRLWRPEGNRGRIVVEEKDLYYIDCYNANPASMQDALSAFFKAAPESMPRLLVLGAMNELGSSALDLHTEVGRHLALRREDAACFVGPDALTRAYAAGALAAGAAASQLQRVKNTGELKSIVAEFSGALFLKGSRSYQLEALLSDSLSQPIISTP
ncbi:MAG: UDP-N-acetylmuramoyl-tripeptide--D-alanyl-D-alanine ligase [Opitutales bacterium]